MEILGEVTKQDLKDFLYYGMSIEDKNLYKEVNNSQSNIFQFSGGTASGMIQRAHPDNFNDMISITCLARPGASFQFDDFCDNKRNNGKSKYPEFISKFLNDTQGCILTQEQIMAISTECGINANYVRGLLKKLGKANKKKEDLEAWDKVVEQFKIAFKEKGMSDNEIDITLNDFVTLSAYSFNKSHAAAYTYIACETLYMTKYFKPYFWAASLTYDSSDSDKLVETMKNAKKSGFKVLPPDVNISNQHFTPVENGIRFGLNEIKGIGETPCEAIIKNRNYESIIDFIIKNIEEKGVTKRITTALVGSGAFDNLIEENKRKKYLKITEDFYTKKKSKKKPELLKELWEEIVESHELDADTTLEEYIEMEKTYLGGNFFHGMFSDIMIEKIEKLYELGRCLHSFEEVREEDRDAAYIPVQIKGFRYHTQKNGKQMMFISCEDMNGEEVSIPVFASYYEYIKVKFFGEGFYLISVFPDSGNQILFGSRAWTSNEKKQSMMIRWQVK